jgi:hypothetical protein
MYQIALDPRVDFNDAVAADAAVQKTVGARLIVPELCRYEGWIAVAAVIVVAAVSAGVCDAVPLKQECFHVAFSFIYHL